MKLRHRAARPGNCVFILTLTLLLAGSVTPPSQADEISPGDDLGPMGTFRYPAGTLAHAEIHRQLANLSFVDEFDRAMAEAGRDAGARRAAQIRILSGVREDPIELFRQLRSERPVLALPDLDMVLVTRDRDVRKILDNPTVFSVKDYRDRMEPVVGPYMLNRDSHPYYNIEEKQWMRSLMKRSDLPRLQRIVHDATASAIQGGVGPDRTLDVVPSLGRGVPVVIVQEYFGLRAPSADMLRWSLQTQDSFFHNVAYVRGLRGFLIRTLGVGGADLRASQVEALEVHRAAFGAGKEMRSFLDDYIDTQSSTIRSEDTVLARMLAVNDSLTHPKTLARIRSNIMGGLVGAVETSNAAVVQSVNQLLARPEVLRAARAAARNLAEGEPIEDSPFAAYVWEALRFHPINPFVVRYIQRNTLIGDGDQAALLRKGKRVLVATHSAMMDPRTVWNPDRFEIDRPARDRRMNLGYAMHRCLGDYVAMVMIPEIVRQLVLHPGLARVPETPAIEANQGIDFGPRGSFPERYRVRLN